MERIESPKEIFKLTTWATLRQPNPAPSIIHEERLISNQAERACILRDCLLARYSASYDIPPGTTTDDGSIQWTEELNETVVGHCILGKQNAYPRVYGISMELFSACWESIGKYLTHLFRACIKLVYHPSNFILAEVVLLPNPGRNPSSVKDWRPTSLLLCLGRD